jgi:hypothetical protein
VFFDGWAPDLGAFSSGIDFSTRDVLDGEMELLEDWYLRTIGEIPAYVGFLRQHRATCWPLTIGQLRIGELDAGN